MTNDPCYVSPNSVWVELLPMRDGTRRGLAEIGDAESQEEHDAMIAVAEERMLELIVANDAVDDAPGGFVGADEWLALCHDIAAEGRRRAAAR